MKLRGAFIGFGNIAQFGHYPSYAKSTEAEIVAVMDPSAARQEAARKLNSAIHTYSMVDELFAKEKLDFVDICTPPSSHALLALKALAHGCHVLCEKPLTLKLDEYKALADGVNKSGRALFTVHNWKCAPIFQKAISLIKEGRIGHVWHAEIFTLRDNVCKGVSDGQPSPDPLPQGEGHRGQLIEDWRKNAAVAGGGILVDHGWHSFYLLLNLVGAEPKKILAKLLKPADQPEGLEEVAQTLVQFPEANGYIHLTWRAQIRRNTMMVQGDKGMLFIDDDRLVVMTFDGKREECLFPAALSAGSHHADWFETLLPTFIEEVVNPTKRGTNFREAGWCLALTSAAYESSQKVSKEIEVSFPS